MVGDKTVIISESLTKMIDTSYELLHLSNEVMHSCRLKKHKKSSAHRLIISFFLRRSQESFDAFLALLKEGRVVDASLLLRCYTEMGINAGYIFNEEENKELRSLQYIIEGDSSQLRLINGNMEGFKEFDQNIENRRDHLKKSIEAAKNDFKEKYPNEKPELPPLKQRAKTSGISILDKFYNQTYRYYSNIEHSTMHFGRDYIDENECEPLEHIEEIDKSSLFKPGVLLYLFRIIFIEILKTFNSEFHLDWAEEIETLYVKHESEYELIKES